MGICGSTTSTPVTNKSKLMNLTTTTHFQYNNILSPLIDFDSKQNLNNRYSYMYKLLENSYSGYDIFQTNSYISFISETKLQEEIDLFWGSLIRNKS